LKGIGMDLATALVPWLAAGCALAGLVGLAGWRRPARSGLARLHELLSLACLTIALVTWVARWVVAGHLPLFGTFESSLSLSFAALLGALLIRFRTGSTVPWTAAALGAAALLLHGRAAWAAFAALLANAGFALHRLVARDVRPGPSNRRLSRSLSVGFLLHSAMLVSGSVYEFMLFGGAWSFDPVETLGLLTWLAYGTLLHLHLFAGWEGRRLAGWCLALFAMLSVSYRCIVYFPAWSTYHVFDLDRRVHVMGSGEPPGSPEP
jgi:ABC-type transport system involved in cytochrome c biogenesis permease subunit